MYRTPLILPERLKKQKMEKVSNKECFIEVIILFICSAYLLAEVSLSGLYTPGIGVLLILSFGTGCAATILLVRRWHQFSKILRFFSMLGFAFFILEIILTVVILKVILGRFLDLT